MAEEAKFEDLRLAIFYNDTAKIKELVSKFKDQINNKFRLSGQTPLMEAASYNQPEAFKIILEEGNASLTEKDSNDQTATHLAARSSTPKVLAEIIKTPIGRSTLLMKDSSGKVPLFSGSHDEAIKLIISTKEGQETLKFTDRGKRNILHHIVNHWTLSKEMLTEVLKYPQVTELINARNVNGFTPVMSSVFEEAQSSERTVAIAASKTEILLKVKNVEITDKDIETAHEFVKANYNDTPENKEASERFIKKLEETKAKLDAKNGKTVATPAPAQESAQQQQDARDHGYGKPELDPVTLSKKDREELDKQADKLKNGITKDDDQAIRKIRDIMKKNNISLPETEELLDKKKIDYAKTDLADKIKEVAGKEKLDQNDIAKLDETVKANAGPGSRAR